MSLDPLALSFGDYTFAVTPAIRIDRRAEADAISSGTRHLWSGEGILTGATRAVLDAAWSELRDALDGVADLSLSGGSPPMEALTTDECLDGPRCDQLALLDATSADEPYALRFAFRFTALVAEPGERLPGGAVSGHVTRSESCGPDGIVHGSASGTLIGRGLAGAVATLAPPGVAIRKRSWQDDAAAESLTFTIEWERGSGGDANALRSEETLVYETARRIAVLPVLDRNAPPVIQQVGGELVTITQRGFAERADRYADPPTPVEREFVSTERISFPSREPGADSRGGRFRTEWHYEMHPATPRRATPAR
jgi:hypothetical protein